MLPPVNKLTRAIRVLTLIALVFFAVKAYPARAEFECGDHKTALRNLFETGYSYLLTAIDSHANVIQMFVNLKTGVWVQIGVDDKMASCVLMHGSDFEFAYSQGI